MKKRRKAALADYVAAKWTACVALATAMMLISSLGGALYAAEEKPPVRTYTFKEVGDIAQIHSSEILKQKSTLEQAAQSKESSLTSYQNQVSEYYSDPDTKITESALYNLQDSYESALQSWQDADEALEKLKPKVAYQAQKLYLDLLQGELQMEIQEKEILRLKDEYELARVKTAFGVFTQTQLSNAKAQWESAVASLDNLQATQKNNENAMREYLNLADAVEFKLENPPDLGQYKQDFDESDVLANALKNSLALKQAQREVDDLSKKIDQYRGLGENNQADRLAAGSGSKDLALKETQLSLTRTVEKTMADYQGLETTLDKAKESLYAAQKARITARMRQSMGLATLNDLRTAEKAVLAAEKEVAQAQYNGWLGTKKVALLKDGILVN